MDSGGRGLEEPLQIPLRRCPSEHHRVVVDKCHVLALFRGESVRHLVHLPSDRTMFRLIRIRSGTPVFFPYKTPLFRL